jgi:hypothetical protein
MSSNLAPSLSSKSQDLCRRFALEYVRSVRHQEHLLEASRLELIHIYKTSLASEQSIYQFIKLVLSENYMIEILNQVSHAEDQGCDEITHFQMIIDRLNLIKPPINSKIKMVDSFADQNYYLSFVKGVKSHSLEEEGLAITERVQDMAILLETLLSAHQARF